MRTVVVERHVHHPIDQVFARYTDHVGWSAWAGLGRVRLVREGAPERDGVGAVRAFSLSPGLREEIVRFEPPTRMDYEVTAGMPLLADHHGTVTFTEEDGGTRVRWHVTFRCPIAPLGALIERGLVLLFGRLLARFERELDHDGAASGPKPRASVVGADRRR